MSIVRNFVCQIETLSSKGLGVSGVPLSSDSSREFITDLFEVPYVLPGEIVELEEHSYRGKSSFVISKVLKKSPERIAPPCKYFTICGGCSLQHLKLDYYHRYKLQVLEDSLNSRGVHADVIFPTKSIGDFSRRRAVFEAVKKHDQVFLGFKKYHSNQIVNIDSCLVLLPELSDLIDKLKTFLGQVLTDKEKCKILITKADNGIDLIIETENNFEISEKKVQLIKDFSLNNSVIKITIVVNNKWNVVHFIEQPYVVFENVKVGVNSYSFLQVSKSSDVILAQLVNKVLSQVSLTSAKKLKIIDLFCGRGTLSIPAAKFGVVDGFEIDKDSIRSLKEANITNVHPSQRDLFTNPVSWDELSRYDVAIINPPRAGAKEQSKALSQSAVKVLVYLSCDVESFARDAKIIMQNKRYILREITPIDQFYWSSHLEIFAVFVYI